MSIALIGSGKWGQNIARTLHALGELTVVVDRDVRCLEKVSKDFPGVHCVSSLSDLESFDLKAAVVATPVETHFSVASEVLEMGLDTFVEKPLAMSAAEAQALCEQADLNGRILMVGHLLLYSAAIECVRENITAGRLGRVYSIHQERLNLGKVRSAENALWSLGVHDVAVLAYLVGEAPSRVSQVSQDVLQTGISDDQYVHFAFPSGTKAHLHVSWLWPEKRRKMVVVGEKGMISYDEVAQKVIFYRKSISKDLSNVDEGEEVLFAGTNEQPLTVELEHFIRCVETRQQPRSDGRSGSLVVSILEQATGHEVLRL